jgi:hypothetical protein
MIIRSRPSNLRFAVFHVELRFRQRPGDFADLCWANSV